MSKATKPSEVTFSTLSDLPPSAKLVIKVLENQNTLTQQELAKKTYLPKRTVRHAVRELTQLGFVEYTVHFSDARKRLYSLSDAYIQNIEQCDQEYEG
ncbi:helix-turn-helix domain-containing protein [Haloarcula sp. JP-L23]|uniref:MarR family transcriptional regulator n=1 Tax=Haloarcula sp. JP-L23 TaxID=2716717 RepID=UPI00140F14B0|nr:MarR family transcriptional regulator [Haloarcula sp. JP-L23]